MTKVAIDTSVIIEYIDKKGENHEQAQIAFSAFSTGKLEAIIPVRAQKVFVFCNRI